MKFVIPMVIVTVLGVALSAAAGAETPRVVASIKPVHSLVAGVMAARRVPATSETSEETA